MCYAAAVIESIKSLGAVAEVEAAIAALTRQAPSSAASDHVQPQAVFFMMYPAGEWFANLSKKDKRNIARSVPVLPSKHSFSLGTYKILFLQGNGITSDDAGVMDLMHLQQPDRSLPPMLHKSQLVLPSWLSVRQTTLLSSREHASPEQ